MKKLILFIFILSFSCLKAQVAGLLAGGGFTVGVYNHLSGLNNVITDYNKNRPWLNTKMPYFGTMPGIAADMSFFLFKKMIKIEWTGNNETHQSSGLDKTGKNGYNEIRIENNTFNLGFGFAKMSGPFCFIIAGSFDVGMSETYFRTWYDGTHPAEFVKTIGGANQNFGLSICPELFIQVSKQLHINIKPYYGLNFSDYKFGALAEKLGIKSDQAYYNDHYKSRPTRFGLDIKLMWGGVVEK